jgi:hypothetical protein
MSFSYRTGIRIQPEMSLACHTSRHYRVARRRQLEGAAAAHRKVTILTVKELYAGRAKVRAKAESLGTNVNGWDISPANAGEFGQDYLTRSAAAWKYIYVNSAVEAMYPTANVDGGGKQLDGSSGRYELKFPKGDLPPVNYFWSLTLYDAKTQVPIENPINRYLIGDRTPGSVKEADGSLTIYVQADKPEGNKAGNWLPAPKAPFYVILRTYGPKTAMLDGTYKIPPMARAN